MNVQEENNYPKAFLATGIILGVVMALCYFIVFREPVQPPDGTGGILVNYGTVDEGMGTDQTSKDEPSKAEKANKQQPTKVTTAPPTEQKAQEDNTDKKVVTQETEDAPTVNSKAKKPSQAVAAQPNKPAAKPVVNQNALYKGPSNKGTGQGDGTGNTPGNQGSKNGSVLSDNYGPGGSGNGLNMPDWTFVSAPDPQNVNRIPGVVVVDFVVDQNGNVISAQSNRAKTRADLSLIEACITAIKNTKFVSKSQANGNQRGQYTFRFKVD